MRVAVSGAFILLCIALVVLLFATSAKAHLPRPPERVSNMTSAERAAYFGRVRVHCSYVASRGRGRVARAHRRCASWARRERASAIRAAYVGTVAYWRDRQIRAAVAIASASSGDPWPNCPDPFDGGGSWFDTVLCENGGSWFDSPGFYRCGLQFDPSWERVYGRLCPG